MLQFIKRLNMNLPYTIQSKLGSIHIYAPQENILVAKPSGYISLRMIRADYNVVQQYPNERFDYYVDLTDFVIPNPVNLYYLHRLNTIPKLSQYILVLDNVFLKMMFLLVKPIIKFSKIINKREFAKILKQV